MVGEGDFFSKMISNSPLACYKLSFEQSTASVRVYSFVCGKFCTNYTNLFNKKQGGSRQRDSGWALTCNDDVIKSML